MKLNPSANIPHFLQAIQNCTGDVYFITPDGDSLNLKSTLSQIVFAAIIAGQTAIQRGSISLKDMRDLPRLEGYLL